MQKSVTVEMLAEFAAAWNRHDIDALMSFMSEDCVFETVGGPEQYGSRHAGLDSLHSPDGLAPCGFARQPRALGPT